MNTSNGFMCGDGIGFMMKGLTSSLLLRFFNEAFFFFLSDDLKEPC
jgi:hypothetical protein